MARLENYRSNYDLKEQIRAYWSARAAGFDRSFSHGIEAGYELDAWKEAYASLVPAQNQKVLELGSGTGEITKVLSALGHDITGIDFSEPMQELSKTKHRKNSRVRYVLGDAENTIQPDDTFDLVTCRHLVWTLLDPVAALADWYRVTKPGGHLVIFDGDFITSRWRDKLLRNLIAQLERIYPSQESLTAKQRTEHNEITSRFYFKDGLQFEHLAGLAHDVGYRNITRHSYEPIRRAQRKIAGPTDWLRTFIGDRFIFHAQK